MVFASAVVSRHDAFKNGGDIANLHLKPGLLGDFPNQCVFQALAGLNYSPRQRPIANQRRIAPLNQQDLVSREDEGPHADKRPRGKPAAFAHFTAANTSATCPSTLTFGKIFLIVPSLSITNVVRSTP